MLILSCAMLLIVDNLAMTMFPAAVPDKDRSVLTNTDATPLHSLLRYTMDVFTLTVLLIICT